MADRIGRSHNIGKQNRKCPDTAYIVLLTDESTLICPNTQITNIEGIDTSVTIDILLHTTTADVLEEFPECPENEPSHFSNKHYDICSNHDIDDDAKYFETPIKKKNHSNM